MTHKHAKACPFCGMPVNVVEGEYVIHQPTKRGSEHGRIFMRVEAWNARPITEIVRPQGSEPKRLVVTCEKEHAPIWLFSGAECEDYQSKQSETQEQK